jgi:hypothetical protein
MTGRGAGYCAGYSAPGYGGFAFGRGFGQGRGGRRGRRNWFYATGLPGWQQAAYGYPNYEGGVPYSPVSYPYSAGPSKKNELSALKDQAEYLEDSLEGIKRRMGELEEELKGQ